MTGVVSVRVCVCVCWGGGHFLHRCKLMDNTFSKPFSLNSHHISHSDDDFFKEFLKRGRVVGGIIALIEKCTVEGMAHT